MSSDVHVSYRLTRALDEDRLAAEMDVLSAEERARCARLVFAGDRRDFAAAHLLLRRSLSAHGPRHPRDWTFVTGRHGKPFLAPGDDGPGLAFSIAHTRGLVTCAVARGVDVGVDVERIDGADDHLDLARRHFSAAEVAHLEACSDAERRARFTELWTLKEAYVKATGAGILRGLDECRFELEDLTSLRFVPADRAQARVWTFLLFGIRDYRLAVAVRAPADAIDALRVYHAGADEGSMKPEPRLLRASTGLASVVGPALCAWRP